MNLILLLFSTIYRLIRLKIMSISNVFIKKIFLLKLMLAIFVFSVFFSVGCMKEMPVDPLTPEERAWLSEHTGKIRLAHDPNAKPIDYIDENGKFNGLAADYVRLLEKSLNFSFDIVSIKTWNEVLRKAKNKEVDVLCAFAISEEREHWMLFTEPYIVIPIVILTRDDLKGNLSLETMKDMKVTFTKGWIVDDYLRQSYSYLNLQPAIDADAAMNNLIVKKADAWVTALTVASIKIEENKVSNIRIAGKTDLSFKLSMASRKDWPVLNNILQKGLAQISEKKRTDISNKWIHIKQQRIFESRSFWIIVSIIIGLTLLPVIIIYSWNKSLKRNVELKTEALENELKERKLAQEALRESEERYRSIFENTVEGFFQSTPEGRFINVNPAFATMIGYVSPEELLSSIFDIATQYYANPEDWHRYKQLLQKDGFVEHFEFKAQCKDGSHIWVSNSTRVMYDRDGKIARYEGNVTDITERKQSAEKLRRAYDEMEIKVDQRTHELSQANIRLQELDRLKSMFIASMSHELRTPLNSIIGFTGILLRGISGKIDAEATEDLNIVYNSSKHLLSLINDVIDISKIEADKLDIHFEDVKLDDLIEELTSIVSKDAEKKNLKIKTEFPVGLTIISDKRRLFQCILNLMSNAIKFTEKGVVKLKVEKTAGLLRISVTDTGIGIKKEDLPKLFKSFIRLETPLKEETAGTGLGLYLTQKIMTNVFQGGVSLESEYGKGSSFTLEIPLKQNIEQL